MPELPEVEIIVNDLRCELIGRKIQDVETDWPKYFQLPKSEAAFRTCVIGRVITGVDRRAKNVLIHLEDGHLLLVHQKISGRLMVGNWERTKRLIGSTHSRGNLSPRPRRHTNPRAASFTSCSNWMTDASSHYPISANSLRYSAGQGMPS